MVQEFDLPQEIIDRKVRCLDAGTVSFQCLSAFQCYLLLSLVDNGLVWANLHADVGRAAAGGCQLQL
jgi:hypothetical protein